MQACFKALTKLYCQEILLSVVDNKLTWNVSRQNVMFCCCVFITMNKRGTLYIFLDRSLRYRRHVEQFACKNRSNQILHGKFWVYLKLNTKDSLCISAPYNKETKYNNSLLDYQTRRQ